MTLNRLRDGLHRYLLPAPSIRNKLVLLSFSLLLVIVGLVFLLVFQQQKRLLQTQLVEAMTAQARLLATNSHAAIAFLDRREAERLLSSLAVTPTVDAGATILADGTVLARYRRLPEAGFKIPAGDNSPQFLGDHLIIREPIQLIGQQAPAGRIELLVALDQYHQALRRTVAETSVLLLIALAASLLLGRYVVGKLTRPLENLDRLVKQVSADGSLDQRVHIDSRDEIGRLGQGFNHMLDTLQGRDQELARYRVSLERMVDDRTRALQEAIAEARSATRAKSDFLARMSHEIRTPMHAIIGLSRMVLETPLAPQQREHLEQVMQSSDALLGIINDILDYSKIEAGGLALENTPFTVAQVFQSVGSLFNAKATAQGLKLRFICAPEVPAMVQGDPLRLGQILINLVGNALKFTAQGEIEVSVDLAASLPEQRVRLSFTVRDTGMGISPEQQDSLFAPFTQADSSITRRFGGTGLGLTICRQLVELMDGHISLESHPGHGSAFHFTATFGLPDSAAASTGVPPQPAGLPRWAGERVLLVEDIPINRTIAIALLQRVGLSVEIATNGQQALDKLATTDFDLILMDIQMPVMDGLTATRSIRADPRRQALPIIAMTAHATSEDRMQTEEAGMNAHLTKPINPRTLYEVIGRWLPPLAHAHDEVPAAANAAPPLPGIDGERGLALHMHRPELYLKSLHAFHRDFSGCIAQIAAALAAGERLEARRLAHSLKSVAGALGAQRLSDAARAVEQALAADAEAPPMAALAHEFGIVSDGLATLPPLISDPVGIAHAAPGDLAAIFDELAEKLGAADAGSEAQLTLLKAVLNGRPALSGDYQTSLAEIGALIDDVEYETALDKLQQLRRTLTAEMP